jgi:hypothetical protein
MLAQKIDRTLLRPDVTMEEISCFLAEATNYPFASRPWEYGASYGFLVDTLRPLCYIFALVLLNLWPEIWKKIPKE